MSKVSGYIIVTADGVPIDDDFGFGATTIYKDWAEAATHARSIAGGGALLRPVIPAASAVGTPRRGRPRKNQQEES